MKKALFIGIGLVILAFWGGAIFGLLLHLIEIILEVLELLTDSFLEAVLALTPYEAQAVTAWLGLGVFILLLVWGLRKLSAYVKQLRIEAPVWWEEEKVRLQAMRSSLRWPLAAAGTILLLIILLYL